MRRGARLGQHFLNADWVARDLTKSVAVRTGEAILEIGPGTGVLTRHLLATGAHVIAIEKDEILVEKLNETFADEIDSGTFTLFEGDVRDVTPDTFQLPTSYVLAANIPYYITGEIIRHFLTSLHQPRAAALLIQKEVAERIVARDGKESILSLSVKAYGKPRIVAKVPAGCFNPPPSVDSAIILIDDISRDFFEIIQEDVFFRIVKAGFASKRKMLAGNLKGVTSHAGEVLKEAGLPEKVRAEDVDLGGWRRVVERLQK